MANRKLDATEDEANKAMMKYLRNSADRCGGRNRRLSIERN